MSIENDARKNWLIELEDELASKQKELNDKKLELEKLFVKKDILDSVGSGINGIETRGKYYDYFNFTEVEKDIEKLRSDINDFKHENHLSYLKTTIQQLKRYID